MLCGEKCNGFSTYVSKFYWVILWKIDLGNCLHFYFVIALNVKSCKLLCSFLQHSIGSKTVWSFSLAGTDPSLNSKCSSQTLSRSENFAETVADQKCSFPRKHFSISTLYKVLGSTIDAEFVRKISTILISEDQPLCQRLTFPNLKFKTLNLRILLKSLRAGKIGDFRKKIPIIVMVAAWR